jgi:hypothetical protein
MNLSNPPTWDDNCLLLLIFKDNLTSDKIEVSPLALPSETIAHHIRIAASNSEKPIAAETTGDRHETDIPTFLPLGDSEIDNPIPYNSCIWGWWRKPWERHDGLLSLLQKTCQQGTPEPSVALYDQYCRRLYRAKIKKMIYEPGLATVVLDNSLQKYCPDYYCSRSHLCGAYFIMTIDPDPVDDILLDEYFVDPLSFEQVNMYDNSIICVPEELRRSSSWVLRLPPVRDICRSARMTMYFLKRRVSANHAMELVSEERSDSELASLFSGATWDEVRKILSSMSYDQWASLNNKTRALSELGNKATRNKSPITRQDFSLFSWACASHQMRYLINDSNIRDGFSRLGGMIRAWLSVESSKECRNEATRVFQAGWEAARKRYRLDSLEDEYFSNLIAFEAIANAVKYQIGNKFYRDHLSHNIRAGLLTAKLAGSTSLNIDKAINASIAGFFCGLLHDLSIPITTFPATMKLIAQELLKIYPGEDNRNIGSFPFSSLVDRDLLRKSLYYVTVLSAIPNIARYLAVSEERVQELINSLEVACDRQLVREQLLCWGGEEHAVVSAAILFSYAMYGMGATSGDPVKQKNALKNLILSFSGVGTPVVGRELAHIIQSIALHDRRPAAQHLIMADNSTFMPQALDMENYPFPAITSIADELQEWGRTIGDLDEIGAIDSDIDLASDASYLKASFHLNSSAAPFPNTPFSILEYFLGKRRTIGRITMTKLPDSFLQFEIRLTNTEFYKFKPVGSGCELYFEFETESLLGEQKRSEKVTPKKQLFALTGANSPSSEAKDFMWICCDSDIITDTDKVLGLLSNLSLCSIALKGNEITLYLSNDIIANGIIIRYDYGKLSKESVPSQNLPVGEKIALLEVLLVKLQESTSSAIFDDVPSHLLPHPHFLDYDWRFSKATCLHLVKYVNDKARERDLGICYLGCPSLAIWQQMLYPNMNNWVLYDKGHFALEQWKKQGLISQDNCREQDVFTEIQARDRGKYGIVISDPPWYEDEYRQFLMRADELVIPGGLVGVTYYPEFLDKAKHETFEGYIKVIFNDLSPLGSIEIDYNVPRFETITGLDKMYMHPTLGLYRLGYMDFYRAKANKTMKRIRPPRQRHFELSDRMPLRNDHHMYIRPMEKLLTMLPANVRTETRHIKHVREISKDVLAWTSLNMIFKKATDGIMLDYDGLLKFIEEEHAKALDRQ